MASPVLPLYVWVHHKRASEVAPQTRVAEADGLPQEVICHGASWAAPENKLKSANEHFKKKS
eukprot:scaffold155337_cov34-Prasinocladus_malaysianus.AAC.1